MRGVSNSGDDQSVELALSPLEESASQTLLSSDVMSVPAVKDVENAAAEKPGEFTRVITPFKLLFLAFFLTSGGPYGIEPLVAAAGPLVTLVGLLALPVLYALPQSLMTAELSTLMPENGGYVIWVQRAFGPFAGWVNSFNAVCCDLFDNALYPVIFVSYLEQAFVLPAYVPYLVKFGIIWGVALLNIRGIEVVSWVSAALLAAITVPLLVMFAWRLPDMRPATQWFGTPIAARDIDWGLFLSTILWCYAGWDSLGTMAGEVKNPQRTYPRGVFLAISFSTMLYVVPILIGLTLSTDPSDWETGYFITVANSMAPWLGYAVLAGAMIANFGNYNSGVAATARVIWAMGTDSTGTDKSLPSVFGSTWKRYETPVVGVIVTSLASSLLVSLDFSILVQCDTFLDCLTLLLEFAAFMWLKYTDKSHRPFVVPGGIAGAWLITVPKVIIVGATIVLTSWEVMWISGVIIAVIVAAYGAKLLFLRTFGGKNHKPPDDPSTHRLIQNA